MAEEKIDVEMQDTGEFPASIRTATGTDETVPMFTDADEISEGVFGNDEATARATVEFSLSHQPSDHPPDRIDLVDIAAPYDGTVESIRKLRGRSFESARFGFTSASPASRTTKCSSSKRVVSR